MNKYLISSILLTTVGIVCFVIAVYLYGSLQELFDLFAHYGLEEQYYSNPKVLETVFNLKFGIIKFTIIGFASLILSIILFLKRKKI